MFRRLRMRLAIWLSPELARYADAGAGEMRRLMTNQRQVIAQTDALRQRGFRGTIHDYQFGVSLAQTGIHFKNKRAMETLYLPKPN